MPFERAERKRAKARIALTGPSGSGKSMAALLIAKGLGGRIAAIDTENESLSLYSDIVPFDVQCLRAPFTPERYIQMIHEAEAAGYDIIIIDSATHEWTGEGGILEIHDKMPGNSWANWSVVTPRHNAFVEAILQSPCHVIVTMRSKTEYVQNEKNGKKTIEKAGAAPQQRDGIDYEFTLCLDIQQQNHVASASKDRTGLWDNRFEKITEKHGKELLQWLESGAEPLPRTVPAPDHSLDTLPDPSAQSITPEQGRDMFALAQEKGVSPETLRAYVKATFGKDSSKEITQGDLRQIVEALENGKVVA